MLRNIISKIWDPRIPKLYSYATIIYILPFLLLFISILDNLTFGLTGMLLFTLFLASMLPCSLAGLTLSIIAMRQSNRENDTKNKDIGVAELFAGIFILTGGIIGLSVLCLITH